MNLSGITLDNALTTAALVWAAKEIYSFFKNSNNKLSKALEETTMAVVELKVEVRHLRETVAPLRKIERDVDEAHAKIRELHNATQKSPS